MSKIGRIYNINRGFIIALVVIIAFAIIFIQVLNSLIKENNEKQKEEMANKGNSSTNSTTISQDDVSAITGQKVEGIEEESKIIKQFVKYCNEGKVEEAYQMISPECKNRLYPSLEHFKVTYYDRIFTMNRMCSLENWYSTGDYSTYQIKYMEDVMASGNLKSENNRGDYITVVKNQNKRYLNISGYVGTQKSKKVKNQNGVIISAEEIHMYVDYTIVKFKVKNNNTKAIILDSKKNLDTMYLYDENNVRYTSFLNENSEAQLKIYPNMETNVEIKFNKLYDPEIELKGIVMKDIVLNYEEFIQGLEEKNSIIIDVEI